MTGLPAALAVLAALPLGLLPRLAGPFRPIRSFELGVPESVLSIDRRRSSSATRSSSRRSRSRDAAASASAASSRASAVSRLASSTATCSSFAAITARSRNTSGCSPAAPGSSDTSRKHAQPELKVQPPAYVGVSHPDPVNGHEETVADQLLADLSGS